MRILFISTFYPPYVVGGWEQLVRDINTRLQTRGHITKVLTSTYGVDSIRREKDVDRLLTLESDLHHYKPYLFLTHKTRLRKNLIHTKETIETFKPDIIFIHVMWNLSKGIAALAEQLYPGRVVYYVANDWPHASDPHTAYWRGNARNRVSKWARQLFGFIPLKIVKHENQAFALKFEHVLCVSQAVKNDLAQNAGIDPARMTVVYNGVETDLFTPSKKQQKSKKDGLSLLYAGSLVSHKGVHTAIEAMAILAKKPVQKNISLSIVGSGHPKYEASLNELVVKEHLTDRVNFLGRIPRERMPDLLRKFDVLIFPSIWEEPLARMTQEAMAAGLVVIGTLTGGTGELLIEGKTGLTFEAGNPRQLAKRIEQLSNDPELFARLVKSGRDTVLRKFSIERMIDEIEEHLISVIENSSKSAVRG